MKLVAVLAMALLLGQASSGFKNAIPSVGQVVASGPGASGKLEVRSRGSGVVVDPAGTFVTNLHVIHDGSGFHPVIRFHLGDPEQPFQTLQPSRLYRAELLTYDPAHDLALLRIVEDSQGRPLPSTARFPAISLGESRSLDFLASIHTIGYPVAGGTTVTVIRGQVSGKDESGGWIKTDAQILQGCSGGAVVDSQGRLVGVATRINPDMRWIDTNQDGLADTNMAFGTVGLVRPVELVRSLMQKVQGHEAADLPRPPLAGMLKGRVEKRNGEAVDGALVGLLKSGSHRASVENLVSWARSEAGGWFAFPNPVQPGAYTLRIRAEGFEVYLKEIEVEVENEALLVQMAPVPEKDQKKNQH